ncbi:hypothetical protein EJ05DRAFT_433118, partial [Pseudovirgaria hyperparasitica]
PYLDQDLQSRWWDFGGDTVIRTDKYIRLTSERSSRAGWLFSRVPLTATNWEITVEFKIHGGGNLYGDGMAMWLTRQRAQGGKVFGSADKFEGIGILFDTYKNNRPGTVFPYVMAMRGDGNTEYDKDNDGKSNELAGCSARGLRNNQNMATKARLTYFADQSLRLDLQYKKEDEWTQCFDIKDVKVPPVAYLGFSAETGELADNHDIVNIWTKNLYQPPGSNAATNAGSGKNKGSKYSKQNKQGGSWTWFFLKFVIFGLVVTGAYVGFTAYRSHQRNSRF